MPETDIRPEELTADEVRQVLDFLNAAASPEEIATAVELPNELDVGTGVARRILARRAALGGRFTDIAQVGDIPLVGPERFSEIVMALTGRIPAAPPSIDDLRAEVQRLRQTVAGLAAGPRTRVALVAVEPEGYLGQPVTLRLRVSVDGRPVVGAMVTVATTWGLLQGFVGLAVTAGRALAVTTDVQGEARLTLHGPLYRRLTAPQLAALTAALDRLDRGAETPADTLPEIEHMVAQYRHERGTALRGAIDLYFQKRRSELDSRADLNTRLASWQREEALVLAYAQADDGSAGVVSLASLVVPMKDWVGPWYRVCVDGLGAGSGLREELDQGLAGVSDHGQLIDQAWTSVHSYVAAHWGLAGEAAAQQVVDRTLRGYLADGIGSLPADSQLAMFSALQTAARTIGGSGMGTLAAVTQTRLDLHGEVATRTAAVESSLGGRIGGLESELANTKGALDQLRIDVGKINTGIDSFQADYARFQTDYGRFNRDYASFRTDRAQFQTDYGKFNQDYASFNRDYGEIKTTRAQFSADYTRFQTDYGSFTRDYAAFRTDNAKLSDNLVKFNADYAQFKVDLGRVPVGRQPTRNG